VHYAEIVASIASKSAGPGTRANIDEFTETTSKAIVKLGGAARGKAIIILNPAEPPLIMRDTVYCLAEEGADEAAIRKSVDDMAAQVASYVPGYRLKQRVQFEKVPADRPLNIPGIGKRHGLKVSIFLEVEGAELVEFRTWLVRVVGVGSRRKSVKRDPVPVENGFLWNRGRLSLRCVCGCSRVGLPEGKQGQQERCP